MQRHGHRWRLHGVYDMAAAAAPDPAVRREAPPHPWGGPVLRAVDARPVVIRGGGEAEPVTDDLDFEDYVTARGAALVRLARGLLRDPQHAEDVVQEVLVRAHQKWGTIHQASNPDAYVYRMVVNACTSFWRRTVRREFAVETERLPAGPVGDGADQRMDREVLLALLRRLPAKQRVVLVLRHYEGLPDAEIAALVGSSPVTVRSNAHRGLATMRKMLNEMAQEEVRRHA